MGRPTGDEGRAPCPQRKSRGPHPHIRSHNSPRAARAASGEPLPFANHPAFALAEEARWQVRRAIDAPARLRLVSRANGRMPTIEKAVQAASVTVDLGEADSIVVDMRYEAGQPWRMAATIVVNSGMIAPPSSVRVFCAC